MRKILFSWLAVVNDFNRDGSINKSGPNVNMQAFHWQYDQHIILYTKDYQEKAMKIYTYLDQTFTDHKTNIKPIDIKGVYIHLQDIKNKVEALLIQYKDCEIDLLLSTGTGLMKIAWYIAHTTLGLKTRMLMILAPGDSREYFEPDLHVITVERSHTPISAMIREANLLQRSKPKEFITESLESIYHDAFKIAQADNVSALILGNTGTGKEVLANYIHNNSSRKKKPFISVNCSAFSDQLLESRLFGHKKGSFTGAYENYTGVFEQAKGGTVFLDEIGDITPYMQQLLLRFLQEKEIQPIGRPPKKVDVRVIAATNKNLIKLIKENKFRADLFYRLGMSLKLPDFKDFTIDEKKNWIQNFLQQKKKEFMRQKPLKLQKDVWSFLLGYDFPGNIRELINIIDNFYVFSDDKALFSHLPQYIQQKENLSSSLLLKDVENEHIKKVLKMYGNNKSKAAKALGISLNKLKSRISEQNNN